MAKKETHPGIIISFACIIFFLAVIVIIQYEVLNPKDCLECQVIDVKHLAIKICLSDNKLLTNYSVEDNKLKYINCREKP